MVERWLPVRYTDLRVQIWGEHMKTLPLPADWLREAVCIPIASEHKIYLLGSGSDDEHKFAILFAKVWEQLPYDVKSVIAAYWAPLTPKMTHYLTQEWAPEIRLLDDWLTKGEGNAASTVNGCLFQFDRAVIGKEPDRKLETRIAHELAHAYLFGTGEAPSKGNPAAEMTDEQKNELVMKRVGCKRAEVPACLKRANRTLDQTRKLHPLAGGGPSG